MPPAVTGSGVSTLVTERSAEVATVVVAVALLLPELGSVVAAETVAVFEITVPAAVEASTWTVRVKTALPTANEALEQETVPPAPTAGLVQLQPAGAVQDVGAGADGLWLSPDGLQLWVLGSLSRAVSVYDVRSVAAPIPIGTVDLVPATVELNQNLFFGNTQGTASLGGNAFGIGGRAGQAVQTAFVEAMNTSLQIGAVVALVGAIIAWLLIADRPDQPQAERVADDVPTAAPEPARAVAEAAGA